MLTMAPPLTSGTITFFELLSLLYPLANEQDLATFKSWCYPEEPKQKIKYVLSAEQRAELKEMFRIIDKDRSGELTVEELMTMFSGSSITGEKGVNEEELKVFFAEAKLGGSNSTACPPPLRPTPPPPPFGASILGQHFVLCIRYLRPTTGLDTGLAMMAMLAMSF